ncbi:MAG: POTRA domain-containing protein [Pyrinomonadaceae bacterium]
MKQLLFLLFASFIHLTLLAPGAAAQQPEPAKPLQVGRVEFIGLRRLTQEQALAISGLQSGDPFSEPLIDDGAKKLVDSGLFARLGYRVRSTGNQVNVTFQVEEADRPAQVVFDNFVWFSDVELVAAIRRDVPFFTGTAPESGSTVDEIAKALQRLLEEKKIPGRVEYLSADLSQRLSYLFSVKGVPLRVCSLHFPGAAGITEDELRNASKQLTENDYSKTSTGSFAAATLFPLYRQKGRLRAKFAESSAVLEIADTSSCKGALAVTIPVDECAVYSWEKADWTGNASVSGAELDAALSMKSGDVADGLKFDKGMQFVRKAFGHKGYIAVRIKPAAEFDDEKQRVTFKMEVTEGPQYHMGNLKIVGLGENDAQILKEDWRLPVGTVYDTAYVEEFMRRDIIDVLRPVFAARGGAGWPPKIGIEEKPDRQKLTVDVTITVTTK